MSGVLGLALLTLAVGFAGGAGVGVAYNAYGEAGAVSALGLDGMPLAEPVVAVATDMPEPLAQGRPRPADTVPLTRFMFRTPSPLLANVGVTPDALRPAALLDSRPPHSVRMPSSAARLDAAFTPEPAYGPALGRGSRHDRDTGQTMAVASPPAEEKPIVIAAVNPRAIPNGNGKGARIAIVLDDLGMNRRATRRAIELDSAITLAFLPYADKLVSQVSQARAVKHEILLHMPMEPLSHQSQLGTNPLLTVLDDHENLRRLRWALDRLPAEVGLNNHMGSRFTANRGAMDLVMRELDARGLFFIDSRTTAESVADNAARAAGVPFASRDVFLDNERDVDYILGQLRQTEGVARRKGHAVAIGHGVDVTIDVLQRWIPSARERGFELVPASQMAYREFGKSVVAQQLSDDVANPAQ